MDPINHMQQLVNYRSSLQEATNPHAVNAKIGTTDETGKTFSDYFSQAFTQINQKVEQMDQDTLDVITGNETDLAQVMIRMNEAQLTLQTATQIRNKCLEAYNDIKGMQF
ncbi:flagellar hook-basal body complex protein FliE [Enterococcus sp. LJL98]